MKLLDAQKKDTNEISVSIPLTYLERFALAHALNRNLAGPEGRSRKDIDDALKRSPAVTVTYDDALASPFYVFEEDNLTAKNYEKTTRLVLTDRMLRDLSKMIDEVAPQTPGKHAFALYDLQDRVKWVLEPAKE